MILCHMFGYKSSKTLNAASCVREYKLIPTQQALAEPSVGHEL